MVEGGFFCLMLYSSLYCSKYLRLFKEFSPGKAHQPARDVNSCFTRAETEALWEPIKSCFSSKGHRLLHSSEKLREVCVPDHLEGQGQSQVWNGDAQPPSHTVERQLPMWNVTGLSSLSTGAKAVGVFVPVWPLLEGKGGFGVCVCTFWREKKRRIIWFSTTVYLAGS